MNERPPQTPASTPTPPWAPRSDRPPTGFPPPPAAPTAPAAGIGWPAGPPPAPSRPPLPPTGFPPAGPPTAGPPPGLGGGPGGTYRAPAPASASPRPRRGRRGLVALAAVAVFASGAAGVAVGHELVADDATGWTGTTAVVASPVATVPGPVSGKAAEPAAAVAEALGPAVVQIETSSGLGSGFVYDADGLILTAAHVVDGSTQVDVRLADGTRATGQVLGEDDATDVAVVRIDGRDDLPVAALATGVPLQVGQVAIAIGSPFGLDQTVTAGIVSAVGRSTQTPGGVIPAIQTDAPINSGNSGGALADRTGRVIGINDSIVTGSSSAGTGNVGVGFAIPIDIAKAVADDIAAGRSTDAGFLGVEGADATGQRAGAAITKVESGSPAGDAGITTDDVVTAVDGRKVASMIDLAAAVRTAQPGEKVTLTVLRDGTERRVEVTLGTAP
jgi:putative serine protease PepD